MEIVKATHNDITSIMAIYQKARDFMVANGNANQWVDGYPAQSLIEQDINKGHCYLCQADGQTLAAFYFAIEDEPTYQQIEDGKWLNDSPYGVLHRIAVAGSGKGVASYCINWCFERQGNLRIDTHKDNAAMRHIVTKLGFDYCGIIYVKNGTPRLAYQKCMN